MKNKSEFVLLFLVVFFSSCNFNANVTYENEEAEKQNAESVTAKFYLMLSNNNFEGTLDLFSVSFYKFTPKEELLKYLGYKREKLGDFKDYSLKEWKTHRVKGTNSITQYLLIYEVTYNNAKVVERVTLVKEGNDILICGYSVDEPKSLQL